MRSNAARSLSESVPDIELPGVHGAEAGAAGAGGGGTMAALLLVREIGSLTLLFCLDFLFMLVGVCASQSSAALGSIHGYKGASGAFLLDGRRSGRSLSRSLYIMVLSELELLLVYPSYRLDPAASASCSCMLRAD